MFYLEIYNVIFAGFLIGVSSYAFIIAATVSSINRSHSLVFLPGRMLPQSPGWPYSAEHGILNSLRFIDMAFAKNPGFRPAMGHLK